MAKSKVAKNKIKVAMKVTKTVVQKQVIVARGSQKLMQGRVVSAKMPKTVTVLVEHRKTHPLYGKSVRRSKRYLVHDGLGAILGDVVQILQTRPMSKNKHFKVGKIVGRDMEAIVEEQLKMEAEKAIAEVMPEEKIDKPSDVIYQTEETDKKEKNKKERKGLKA